MKHLERLRGIENEVFTNMGKTSQKTIDIVQETIGQLDRDYGGEDEALNDIELGAISYEISILLEVWDKELEYDIYLLRKLDKVISDWYDDI